MTRHIIKLDPQDISYKDGGHGSYYDPDVEWTDWSYEQCYVVDKEIKRTGRYHSCHVLSDETFIRLWFKCSTIEQFVESYKANHEHPYKPSSQACRMRAKKIEQRLMVTLPPLQNEPTHAEVARQNLRHLVRELEVEQLTQQVGIIPPMLH